MNTFSPDAIFRALDEHGVTYVLIGGLAAILHGATHVTIDVDIVPEEDRQNLERLSEALKELHARIRVSGEPNGIPFDHGAESLARVRTWNLTTELGDLDITFVPDGTRGYADLQRDAETIPVKGIGVPVASLADVIRSKEAANRDKDRLVLPTLRHLLSLRASSR